MGTFGIFWYKIVYNHFFNQHNAKPLGPSHTPHHPILFIYFFNLVLDPKDMGLLGVHEALVDIHPCSRYTPGTFPLSSEHTLHAPVTLFYLVHFQGNLHHSHNTFLPPHYWCPVIQSIPLELYSNIFLWHFQDHRSTLHQPDGSISDILPKLYIRHGNSCLVKVRIKRDFYHLIFISYLFKRSEPSQ